MNDVDLLLADDFGKLTCCSKIAGTVADVQGVNSCPATAKIVDKRAFRAERNKRKLNIFSRGVIHEIIEIVVRIFYINNMQDAQRAREHHMSMRSSVFNSLRSDLSACVSAYHSSSEIFSGRH